VYSSTARIGTLRRMATRPESERRPSGLMVVLAFGLAVAVAVALVVVAVVARNDNESAPPSSTPAVDLVGIPQRGAVLGAPDATVTLIEYADLQCPACGAYTEGVLPAVVTQYVRRGRVKTEFRGVAFIGPDSLKALRFVYAAGLQDHLWDLQEALYRNQGGENDGWVTDDLVRELGGQIEGLDVDRLFADAESSEVASLVDEAEAQADAAQIPGTPALFLQVGDGEPELVSVGVDSAKLAAALDDALAG
jgi:protein-disulfide isomerase